MLARVVDQVAKLLWPVLLPLFLASMGTWLIMDNLSVARTFTDVDRSVAVVATVVGSEVASRGAWTAAVRFSDTVRADRTEYLYVGDKKHKVGREVTVRYELGDPTVVQAEPVAASLRGDRLQYLVVIVLGGIWLLGCLAFRSLADAGSVPRPSGSSLGPPPWPLTRRWIRCVVGDRSDGSVATTSGHPLTLADRGQ